MEAQFKGALNALVATPAGLFQDLPSVIAYAGIEWVHQVLEDMVVRMGYSTPIPEYLLRGVNDTLKKEYFIKYHSVAATLPK